ncbi:MAG TPA: ECF transporter S component [Firmicutes bacterium]|nr:ECF transporter S component [Bacillota bacterium]
MNFNVQERKYSALKTLITVAILMGRNSNKRRSIESIAFISIFTALNIVITVFISIPINNGQGYLNLSDALTILISLVIHPLIGGAVGGISGLISDLALGYGVFAPFTFIIKALEGILSGYLFRITVKRNKKLGLGLLPVYAILAGLVMSGLYFVTDMILYRDFSIATIDIALNALQGLFGAIVAIALSYSLFFVPIWKQISITTNALFLQK